MPVEQEDLDNMDPNARRAINHLIDDIQELKFEIETLRTGMAAMRLFAARDNLETALFAAMDGKTDEEQELFIQELTAHINSLRGPLNV